MTKSRNPGRRLIAFALCLICLFTLALPAAAQPEETAEVTKQTGATTVVHTYAYASSAPIGRMENGTPITVLAESGSFYKIDCYDMVGYVAKEQVLKKDDGTYCIDCKEDSADTVYMVYEEMSDVLQLRQSILELVQKQVGYPYVYGGTRPGGFDCSGLMYYLYGQHGYTLRRTASMQFQDGIIVAKEGLQVGDLIFFLEEGCYTHPVSHVGIYVGNGQIIHSGSKGVGYASLDGYWFADYYKCARRMILTNTAELTELVATVSELAVTSASGRSVR